MKGGFWATMVRVSIRNQPSEVASEVVVRLAPDRAMGAKESEVQRSVGAQGFPTPAVWFSHPDEGGSGWWSVMEFSSGAPLLEGLDGLAALRRAPSLLMTLPTQLAETMAAVHRLDPLPVTAAVSLAAPQVAWSVSDLLAHFQGVARFGGRNDISTALDHLAAGMPGSDAEVLCHGDLHPFNILDHAGQLVVLDWTAAVVADPSFDVGLTSLLLANPPLVLPAVLKPAGRAVGRVLARRFVAAYRHANPRASLESLDWFKALHSARFLLEALERRSSDGATSAAHPAAFVAPSAAGHLTAATGVQIAP